MIAIDAAHYLVLFSMAYLLWKRLPLTIKSMFWPALMVKLAAGVGLGLLYKHYYDTGDTFTYFSDGRLLAALARDDWQSYIGFLWRGDESFPLWDQLTFNQPRALYLSKITSVFCLLCGDNYWIISLYFSFLSFCGAWVLVRVLVSIEPGVRMAASIALLFCPSVVFWTSGLIKESLAMAALYFIVAIFLKAWTSEKIRIAHWIMLPVSLWLLWSLKYYYLAVLIPVVLTALVMHFFVAPKFPAQRPAIWLILWLAIFTIPLYAASVIHPNFYPERFLEVIVTNYNSFAEISDPGDAIVYENLQPDAGHILWYTPKALLSGLFRPFLWETQNMLQLAIAAENTMLLIFFIASAVSWKYFPQSPYRVLIFSAIVYIFLLCVFLSLSTPNFGTLVRYRVGFLPFFIIMVLIKNPLAERLSAFIERTFSRIGRE